MTHSLLPVLMSAGSDLVGNGLCRGGADSRFSDEEAREWCSQTLRGVRGDTGKVEQCINVFLRECVEAESAGESGEPFLCVHGPQRRSGRLLG